MEYISIYIYTSNCQCLVLEIFCLVLRCLLLASLKIRTEPHTRHIRDCVPLWANRHCRCLTPWPARAGLYPQAAWSWTKVIVDKQDLTQYGLVLHLQLHCSVFKGQAKEHHAKRALLRRARWILAGHECSTIHHVCLFSLPVPSNMPRG